MTSSSTGADFVSARRRKSTTGAPFVKANSRGGTPAGLLSAGPGGRRGDRGGVAGAERKPKHASGGVAGAGPRPKHASGGVAEAARDTVAQVIALPIAGLVMAVVRPLDGGGTDAAAQEGIDNLTEALEAAEDPARIPAAVVEEAVTHLLAHLATAAFGPAGPIVVIVVRTFVGELTHQALDSGRDNAEVQFAERGIELAGSFADARIGRLAESEPFDEFVSGLLAQGMAAIFGEPADPGAGEDDPAIKAPVAVDEAATFVVQPAFTDEHLLLPDGTVVRHCIAGGLTGSWVRVGA